MTDEFGTGDTPQRVFLVWGLKNQDLDKCGSSDAECFGDSVFNNKFNLEDVSVQQDLMVSKCASMDIIVGLVFHRT